MSSNTHPAGKSLVFTTFAICALTPAFSQQVSTLPPWLESYVGATATVVSSDSIVESSYTTSSQPADIVKHYSTLLEAAGLPFQPNSDGIGTSIRAAAHECDLLIQIRSTPEGSFVKVSCSAKTQSSSTSSPGNITAISSQPQSTRVGAARVPSTAATPPRPHLSSADFMQMHQQKVAEMGIHREHHDAPAPPLIWPSWLTHIAGTAVWAEPGVDQAKNAILRARYTTDAPMTEIYKFYVDLLKSHEYPTRSSMSTGQTLSGIQQNALGSVEGSNYPDGAPGAYSVIHVSFDRSVLNGPITVTMRFTTHEYIASRGY
jgi:hypothetical protein